MVLYASVPIASRSGSLALFVAMFCVILTMYGGGFATIPAYLADLFGVQYVSAIHGRLLTAWSTAGILGPVLVNYIREFQIGRGVAPSDAYTVHDVRAGGVAGDRVRLQPGGAPGARAAVRRVQDRGRAATVDRSRPAAR